MTTAAYRRFVEADALQAVIAEAAANAQPDDPASLELASAAVRRLFRSGAAPEAVAAAIHAAYTSLGAAEPTGQSRRWRWAHPLPQKTSLGSRFAGQYDSDPECPRRAAWHGSLGHCTASGWQRRHRPRRPSAACRCRNLVGPGGLIICEVDPDPDRHQAYEVALSDDKCRSAAMPWASSGCRASAACRWGRLDHSGRVVRRPAGVPRFPHRIVSWADIPRWKFALFMARLPRPSPRPQTPPRIRMRRCGATSPSTAQTRSFSQR